MIEEQDLDDKLDEVKVVKGLTTKAIKAKWRPTFEAEPDKYYPTKFLKSVGFERKKCPKSGHFFWSKDGKMENCGDSEVTGEYTFIGKQTGIGKEQKQTLTSVWQSFSDSFCNARIPNTAIKRYPVVARWRNDVDFVLAGIFCFQPHCVTGELEPPANPLICPQFCARFNDLDNIGLTGRHYSGFIMLGNQVFNKPGKFVYFKEESIEFNYNWLTQGLKIDPNDISFIEDIWAGGGNLGPCMEYFINGMEIGNMVFMEFKTFPDGSIEKLPLTICDTGIGLERIPWLLNGSPTSYSDTFPLAYQYVVDKLEISMNNAIWEKIGPLSCRLNIDEVENINKTWQEIAELVNEPVEVIRKAIEPIRDLFIILDHARTALMLITDGALPSNVGGGSNLRNIIRRSFAIMSKNEWWDKMSLDEYLIIFEQHKKDLEGLYGEFKEYKSFDMILKMEYERWKNTDEKMRIKLNKYIKQKKKKKKEFDLDDWILVMGSWGVPADEIAKEVGKPIPGNLYYEISQRQETIVKAEEQILYNTIKIAPTKNLYYDDHKKMKFEAKIISVFNNVQQKNQRNIVIFDQSAFYPTSGGQQHDDGEMSLQLGDKTEEFKIMNVEKVGHCFLHILDRELTLSNEEVIGKTVSCTINEERRNQLRCHHSATHIIFASCRKVLGPHVWQNGAKKTVKRAQLDITHYSSVSKEEMIQIQNEANKIILASKVISKSLVDKVEAEKEFGFSLYQGGIVPGNELRIVNIEDTDVEACCGTHCDNTSEVGWLKIISTKRIADGIVRLYFVAGPKVIDPLNAETKVINSLSKMWSISPNLIVDTATRFFKENKRFQTQVSANTKKILNMEVSYCLDVDNIKKAVISSSELNPTIYFSYLGERAKDIKESGKAVVYVGKNFIYGIAADESLINFEALTKVVKKFDSDKVKIVKKNAVGKKKKKVKCCQFNLIKNLDQEKVIQSLLDEGFSKVEL